MIKALWITGLVFTLVACNSNGEGKRNDADTVDHSAHRDGTANTGTTVQSTDTASGDGLSMMAIMNRMMENMKGVRSSGNPDNDFAALMKAHHLGAIEMAQAEVAGGTDPEIKAMAQKMMDDQQREVAEFNTFLSGHTAHGGGDAFFKEAMKHMDNMKMDMDHSGSVDKQFVQMMIPHHQSAIDMAQAYLKAGAHEQKLKKMAENIIRTQQEEIKRLQAWLAKGGSGA